MLSSPIFQNILTVLMTAASFVTIILLSLGCTEVGDSVNCAAATAPSWLVPWLVVASTGLGFVKLGIKILQSFALTK